MINSRSERKALTRAGQCSRWARLTGRVSLVGFVGFLELVWAAFGSVRQVSERRSFDHVRLLTRLPLLEVAM